MTIKARRPVLQLGGLLLGVAASGFFDGIVLHQLLQWHHLLSGLEAPVWADIERQILADGAFHALMYLLAAVGLGLLWRGRLGLGDALRSRSLPVDVLIGFGAWNVLDALLFHWLLGLHRVRMDSAQPLAWDIGWLLLTGVLPLVLAWWLSHGAGGMPRSDGRQPQAGSSSATRSGAARLALARWLVMAGLTCAAGAWSARPAADAAVLLVFYPAGTAGAAIMAGVHAVDGRVVDVSADATVWALALPGSASRAALFLHGARAMASVPAWAGCAQRLRF